MLIHSPQISFTHAAFPGSLPAFSLQVVMCDRANEAELAKQLAASFTTAAVRGLGSTDMRESLIFVYPQMNSNDLGTFNMSLDGLYEKSPEHNVIDTVFHHMAKWCYFVFFGLKVHNIHCLKKKKKIDKKHKPISPFVTDIELL